MQLQSAAISQRASVLLMAGCHSLWPRRAGALPKKPVPIVTAKANTLVNAQAHFDRSGVASPLSVLRSQIDEAQEALAVRHRHQQAAPLLRAPATKPNLCDPEYFRPQDGETYSTRRPRPRVPLCATRRVTSTLCKGRMTPLPSMSLRPRIRHRLPTALQASGTRRRTGIVRARHCSTGWFRTPSFHRSRARTIQLKPQEFAAVAPCSGRFPLRPTS